MPQDFNFGLCIGFAMGLCLASLIWELAQRRLIAVYERLIQLLEGPDDDLGV